MGDFERSPPPDARSRFMRNLDREVRQGWEAGEAALIIIRLVALGLLVPFLDDLLGLPHSFLILRPSALLEPAEDLGRKDDPGGDVDDRHVNLETTLGESTSRKISKSHGGGNRIE
jgi:hypothetical protein